MIPENLLNQAARWGFRYEVDKRGMTSIYSNNPDDRWKLELVSDRWILKINEIPQINFLSTEALQFLERQWLQNKTNSSGETYTEWKGGLPLGSNYLNHKTLVVRKVKKCWVVMVLKNYQPLFRQPCFQLVTLGMEELIF